MNLARHLGLFSWAVASRLLPLIYGLVFIFAVLPAFTSVAEFGRYALVFKIFTFLALLNKSFVLHPMIRYASDPNQYQVMIRSGFQLSVLFYGACALLVWLLAVPTAAMLRLDPADLRLVMLLILAFFFRDFGFYVQQTLYQTSRLFFIEAVYFLGSSAGFLLLVSLYGGPECPPSPGGLVARQVLTVNIYAAAASSLLALGLGFNGAGIFRGYHAESVKKLVRYGIETLPIGLANSFLTVMDTLVLGIIYNPAVVGVYNGAKEVYRVVSAITQAVGILVLPYTAKLFSTDRRAEIKALFEKTTAYIWIGLVGVAAAGWLFAGYLYGFLGEEYTRSLPLLWILLLAAPFEGVFNVSGNFLYGMGQARRVTLVSTGSLVIMMVILLPGAYFLGMTGAAWAVCIGFVCAGIWMFNAAGKQLETGVANVWQRLLRTMTVILKMGKI